MAFGLEIDPLREQLRSWEHERSWIPRATLHATKELGAFVERVGLVVAEKGNSRGRYCVGPTGWLSLEELLPGGRIWRSNCPERS